MTLLATLSEKDFDNNVLFSDLPVLLDFQADWCKPCKLMEPLMEELAREFAGRIRTFVVDVDANPGLAERCGVTSIPTVLIFKAGRIVRQRVGATSLPVLENLVQESITQ